MRLPLSVSLAGFLLAAFGLAASAADPASVRDGRLVTPSGRTLYFFDGDKPGVSLCRGGCLMTWIPLTADAAARDREPFTLIERRDGSRQWAYQGRPLYAFIGDHGRGETAGEGIHGLWHTVRP